MTNETGSPISDLLVEATVYPVTGTSIADPVSLRTLTNPAGAYELTFEVAAGGAFAIVTFEGDDDPVMVTLDEGETVEINHVVERDAESTSDNSEAETSVASSNATLLAYLPFEGGSPNETARGLETNVVGDLQTIEGRYGDGALFKGDAFAFFPLDIDFTNHPRLTVTAWVLIDDRRDGSEYRSGGSILSTGANSSGTPRLGFRNAKLRAATGREDKTFHGAGALPVAEWVHVAGVWDYGAQTLRLHVGESVEVWDGIAGMNPGMLSENDRQQQLLEHPSDPERDLARYVLVGAQTLRGNGSIGFVGLDDLRIYAGALSPEEIAAIRESDEEPAELGQVAPPPSQSADEGLAERGEREDETGRAVGDGREEGDDEGDRRKIDYWRLADDYELTSITGSGGDRHRRADLGSGIGSYIHGIEIAEEENRPCRLDILKAPGSNISLAREETLARGANCPFFSLPFRTAPLKVEMSEPYYLQTIAVCQNRRNERVKGLRVWGRRIEIDQAGTALHLGDQNADADWGPNCHEWARGASCKRGQVASGVQVHFANVRTSEREAIVGLRLICRDIVVEYDH